jgi:hypothetical protein
MLDIFNMYISSIMNAGRIHSILCVALLIMSCSAGAPSAPISTSGRQNADTLCIVDHLDDATILNFFFGDSLVMPVQFPRDTVIGSVVHHQYPSGNSPSYDSILITCDTLFFFAQNGVEHCFIPITGQTFVDRTSDEVHYFLVLKQEDKHWILADSVWNIELPCCGAFDKPVQNGPYALFRYKYKMMCEEGVSLSGMNYIAVNNGELAPAVNYHVDTYWSDSCSMGDAAETINRTVDVRFDTTDQVLYYAESEKYIGSSDKNSYTSFRESVCYSDTCFVTKNWIHWQLSDRVDTVFFMNEVRITEEIIRLKKSHDAIHNEK